MVILIENAEYNNDSLEYAQNFETFPYPLSDFQKYAIQHIVQGNHVFCNVPTGSGKTLPALFAISHLVGSLHRKVIYCSPIKSLSNQKYHEFKEKFPDYSVGLITGDIKINQNADIIICTTEILMNFLMNVGVVGGATHLELNIDDIAMVILDECHYVFDVERGYVWETVIMKLPTNIQLLMLSGSFRDPVKFGEWIESRPTSTVQQVAIIIDTHRIVPLTHYTYLTVNEGFIKKIKDKTMREEMRNKTNKMLLLQEAKGQFNDTTYHTVQQTLEEFKEKQQYINRKFVLNNVTEFIKQNEMLPAIFFVFSRKLCEEFAKDITANVLEDDSKIPYTIANEYEQFLRKKLPNYREYLDLPEYVQLIRLLEKGIAYHHSGMLPILREMVEFAINENKVKLLFATESFGIGLNCAIKTTIFTQLKKHDGFNHRFLYSHEYLQMAGRAGRRGIDTKGYVIHLNNMFYEHPTLLEYKGMLKCQAPQMKSQYYVSYGTILMGSAPTQAQSILEYELNSKIKEQQNMISELQTKLQNKERCILMCKTPEQTIHEYIALLESNKQPQTSKKQREKNEKQMRSLHELHYNIVTDAQQFMSFKVMKDEYIKEEYYLTQLQNYMQNQMESIRIILNQRGYTEGTIKWKIASKIHEIHPLIITDFISTINDTITVEYLIKLLSLWSNIKVKRDNELCPSCPSCPSFVKEIRTLYDKYLELEIEHNVEHKTKGEDDDCITINYVGDIFEKWATKCNNIEESKHFIQTELNPCEISLGDFTKGCLKMVAISKELECALNTSNDYIELAQKFGQIERMICKFIVTSQSLYV